MKRAAAMIAFVILGTTAAIAQSRPTYQALEQLGYRYVAKDQPGYVSWCSWVYVRRCSDPVYYCSCGGQDRNYGRCQIVSQRVAAHYQRYCQH